MAAPAAAADADAAAAAVADANADANANANADVDVDTTPPLRAVATAAAGVKHHLCLATALPSSSTPSNAAAADATGAIEPRLHRPPSVTTSYCTALFFAMLAIYFA